MTVRSTAADVVYGIVLEKVNLLVNTTSCSDYQHRYRDAVLEVSDMWGAYAAKRLTLLHVPNVIPAQQKPEDILPSPDQIFDGAALPQKLVVVVGCDDRRRSRSWTSMRHIRAAIRQNAVAPDSKQPKLPQAGWARQEATLRQ